MRGAGFPGSGRMSGLDAGCPGPVGFGVWAAAAVVAPGAGCPGPVAAGSSSFSFLCFRAHLALVLGFSMVSSGVPEYEQGLRLK